MVTDLEHEHLCRERTEAGWSLDWYGLRDRAFDCSHLFVPGQLHLMFNLSGQGVVMGERTRIGVSPSTISMCFPRSKVMASRLISGQNHEFILLSMTAEWLKKTLGHRQQSIYEALWASVSGDQGEGKPVGHVRSMTLAEKDMARQLSDPPVQGEAATFWYIAKVTEILALHLFRPTDKLSGSAEEPFCLTRKKASGDRVGKVNAWLEDHLDEPLELAKIAEHVGCAPHYLSRLFSKEVGRTISQQLRAFRIEKAAELMDSGRYNVTEAAFEVGYNSLSHFTKAFVLEKGIKPSEYLNH
ncbi:helix-turn-helix transcriptional regulator [Verrucomicrobiaceae bacterium R5-34]|nr:helix-turn-helix transcriptional regulator [Verrucomicrobiaceae bacterium R5-34]